MDISLQVLVVAQLPPHQRNPKLERLLCQKKTTNMSLSINVCMTTMMIYVMSKSTNVRLKAII